MIENELTKSEILKKTGNTVWVNRASFSVEAGETFVFMRLSGSGKSTLVRLSNRLIEPTEGSILIDGVDLSKMKQSSLRQERRAKLSMVAKSIALFPHRTMIGNQEL